MGVYFLFSPLWSPQWYKGNTEIMEARVNCGWVSLLVLLGTKDNSEKKVN